MTKEYLYFSIRSSHRWILCTLFCSPTSCYVRTGTQECGNTECGRSHQEQQRTRSTPRERFQHQKWMPEAMFYFCDDCIFLCDIPWKVLLCFLKILINILSCFNVMFLFEVVCNNPWVSFEVYVHYLFVLRLEIDLGGQFLDLARMTRAGNSFASSEVTKGL